MTTVDLISRLIESRQNVFLHGPGGTGKSYTIKKLAKSFLADGVNVSVTSTTGISAYGLMEDDVHASTIHKWAGIGTGEGDVMSLIKSIKTIRQSALMNWYRTEVLIIDEVSMLGGNLFFKLNEIGKILRKSNRVFGGIKLIVCGDMYQLPPVKDNWVFKTEAWKECNFFRIELDKPYRYKDMEWFGLLLRARIGKLNENDIAQLAERKKAYDDAVISAYTPSEMYTTVGESTVTGSTTGNGACDAIKPTRLYSTRRDVEGENILELSKFDGAR